MERVSLCSTPEGKRRAVESLCASEYCRSIRRSRTDRARSPLPSRMRSGRLSLHCWPRYAGRYRLRIERLRNTRGSLPAPPYTLR
eukprot:5567178-Pleurochrysis_carterae.AAC.3